MKRDKKLLLEILQGIEANPPFGRLEVELTGGRTKDEVIEHLNLLGEKNLVELPSWVPAYHVEGNVFRIIIKRLTMEGHDYLDDLRRELS